MKKILNTLILSLFLITVVFANTSDEDYGNQNQLKELVSELEEERILLDKNVSDNSITLDLIYEEDIQSENKKTKDIQEEEEEE